MSKFVPTILAALFLFGSTAAFAQIGEDTVEYDERVEAALQDADYEWEIDSDGDFRAKISANTSASALKTVVRAVAITADEMEKELLGTDEL